MGDNVKIINELQDLRYLSWTQRRTSSGTTGTFLKAYSYLDNKKIYYKLSNYDPINGIVGHECVNEIIVDRLLTIFNINHLSYDLVHALIRINNKDIETYICKSNDFRKENESKCAFEFYRF